MEVGSNLLMTEKEVRSYGTTIENVIADLTLPNPEYQNMMRFGKGRFYKKVDTHICYLKKRGDKYIIPRYYFGEYKDDSSCVVNGRKLSSHFLGKPRDYQNDFLTANQVELLSHTGILLEAACGSGKTFLGIWLSYMRGVQTMVLVPTYYLAKQWKQRIEEFTDASVVILSSADKEMPTDMDFTIVVMDLFSVRTLPKELVSNVGHVILDEAHRVGAETYLPILEEIPAKYRTALTATFRRTDGVHRILKYHFGEYFKMESRFPKPLVYAVHTGVQIRNVVSKNRKCDKFIEFLDAMGIDYNETKSAIEFDGKKEPLMLLADKLLSRKELTKTAYAEIRSCIKRGSDMAYPTIDSYLNENAKRRKVAISLIQKSLDAGRTILFLSKRKDTLRSLYKYFSKYKPMLIVSETNERSAEDEKYLQESCPLVLGVTQLAKEGLDIDRLDTLIIHLPIKDTEQAIGRISRLREGKKTPTCLYLLDDCPVTYAVYNNARKFMKINAEIMGERNLLTIGTVLE